MLKQGIKAINAEFIRAGALFQLSFIQSRTYATSFPSLLSLTLMSKSKKTIQMSLDLTPLLKTSIEAGIEGLVLNVDYLENQHCNSIQKNSRKRCLQRTHILFSGL